MNKFEEEVLQRLIVTWGIYIPKDKDVIVDIIKDDDVLLNLFITNSKVPESKVLSAVLEEYNKLIALKAYAKHKKNKKILDCVYKMYEIYHPTIFGDQVDYEILVEGFADVDNFKCKAYLLMPRHDNGTFHYEEFIIPISCILKKRFDKDRFIAEWDDELYTIDDFNSQYEYYKEKYGKKNKN